MYKGPLDVQSLSALPWQIPFFVSLFSFFFSTPATLPGQEEEAAEIMLISPPRERLSHPSGGRKKPIPGSRGKERAGPEDYEEAMREVLRKRQEKSQRQR